MFNLSKKKIVIFIFLSLLFLVPGYKTMLFCWNTALELLHKKGRPGPTHTFMVPMREGIRLSTDVYLPQGDGPWPVILIRTRYDKTSCNPQTYKGGFPSDLIKKGYVFIAQDTRGRYTSEGIDIIYQTDGWGSLQDGYDTCSWIVAQKWCNGKIGTLGNSAQGITQCLLAPTQPPGLACQVIGFAPGDFYDDWAFPGDVPRRIWKEWLENQGGTWLYGEGIEHFPRDEWWDKFNFIEVAPRITIPVLHIGGWYDIWTEGTIRRFQAWQDMEVQEQRAIRNYLLVPGHMK